MAYIYIYMRPQVGPCDNRSIWQQFELIWSGFYFPKFEAQYEGHVADQTISLDQ